MYEIPILFIDDDDKIIEMYQDYFRAKGYRSILIRNGQKGLIQAMRESSSIITLKASDQTPHKENPVPVIIFTNGDEKKYSKSFFIKSAIMTSEVFGAIKKIFNKYNNPVQ